MKHEDLADELQKKYVDDVVGEKKSRTLEDALQEALDNTTPEHSGTPNYGSAQIEKAPEPEWI